jgi:PTH2 family peptidyl-tRNA hydrolase
MEENNYVMYILVNSELKMEKGKIAAQVGHAVEMITNTVNKIVDNNYKDIYKKYLHNGCKKIVLKAKQEELEKHINDKDSVYVIDAGRTQIPAGSLTVVAFLPSDKNKERFRDFKLM